LEKSKHFVFIAVKDFWICLFKLAFQNGTKYSKVSIEKEIIFPLSDENFCIGLN